MSADVGEKPFLTASWRDIVMVTWAVDPGILGRYLARDTELDIWQGQALMSLVAFDFRDVRVFGLPIPLHTRFPEVNLRFYVRRKLPDGTWRRGVTFVQEMVPRAAIAIVARTFYGEQYTSRRMRRIAIPELELTGANENETRSLVYEWKREGEWERVAVLVTTPPRGMRRGSVEEFVAEHYWGYTRRAGRATFEYRVDHEPWNISMTAECMIEADLATLYGPLFERALSASPVASFVASGSPVAVYPGRPLVR